MASREAKVFEAAFVMRLQEMWPGVTRENAVKWMQEYVCAPVGTRGYDWSASTAVELAEEMAGEFGEVR